MDIRNYRIKHSERFSRDLKNVLKYIADDLKSPIASENMLKAVEKRVRKMSGNPLIYPKHQSKRNTYYKLQVKNYTIFYFIENDTIILFRFLYSKRDFKKLI